MIAWSPQQNSNPLLFSTRIVLLLSQSSIVFGWWHPLNVALMVSVQSLGVMFCKTFTSSTLSPPFAWWKRQFWGGNTEDLSWLQIRRQTLVHPAVPKKIPLLPTTKMLNRQWHHPWSLDPLNKIRIPCCFPQGLSFYYPKAPSFSDDDIRWMWHWWYRCNLLGWCFVKLSHLLLWAPPLHGVRDSFGGETLRTWVSYKFSDLRSKNICQVFPNGICTFEMMLRSWEDKERITDNVHDAEWRWFLPSNRSNWHGVFFQWFGKYAQRAIRDQQCPFEIQCLLWQCTCKLPCYF